MLIDRVLTQHSLHDQLLRLLVEAPHQRLSHPGHRHYAEADLLQLVQHQAWRVVHMVLGAK